MIKKKLIALGVSAVAVTAVAGAGFAGWFFDTEAKAETNLGVHITAAYSFGNVDITSEADTVVLDQAGVTLAKSNALDTAITNVTATWTVKNDSYAAAEGKLTYAVNVYVKGSATEGLAKYVNCGTTAAAAESAKGGYVQYSFTVTPSESDIAKGTDNTVVTMTLANPLVYSNDKPEAFTGYEAMVKAIKGEGTTVEKDIAYSVAADDKPVIIEFTVTKANG